MNVIGVRFRDAGKTYYFDPGEDRPVKDELVLVETTQGIEYATVVMETRELLEMDESLTPKPIVRVATQEDWELVKRNEQREKEAIPICTERIAQHGLDMHLVDVSIAFAGNRITFFFTADSRVDFRALVRDLASIFHARIELRQIGVRDEAKMVGGLGFCGRVVCCKEFLEDFHSVSIKMAKEQNLSLNPTKISGICGRLMCCLKYEQSCYESTRKRMPKIGDRVLTPDGAAIVLNNQIVTEKVKVRIKLPDESFELREYSLSEISNLKEEGKTREHGACGRCCRASARQTATDENAEGE